MIWLVAVVFAVAAAVVVAVVVAFVADAAAVVAIWASKLSTMERSNIYSACGIECAKRYG